jgi:hypothetical protein
MNAQEMKLVWPSLDRLASYVPVLERGWSPDNVRGPVAAQEDCSESPEMQRSVRQVWSIVLNPPFLVRNPRASHRDNSTV